MKGFVSQTTLLKIYMDMHMFMIFNDRVKMLQLKCVYPMCEYTVSALYIFLNARERLF